MCERAVLCEKNFLAPPPSNTVDAPEPERLLQLPREAEVSRMGLGDAAALGTGSATRRGGNSTGGYGAGVGRLLARAVHVIEEEPGGEAYK